MIVLDDAQIMRIADPAALVVALGHAFENAGEAPARIHAGLPGDDHRQLLLMPAWDGREAIGVKVLTYIPSNRERGRPTIDGVYVLLNGETGQPIAILSAPALTALRTAAVSALAASMLARTDARTLLIIGTGALAPYLIRAHLAVRSLEQVVVWGRNRDKTEDVVQRLSSWPVKIEATSELSAAVTLADIISSATSSEAPLIEGKWVAPGTHVDLVGSFTEEMREADNDLFRRGRLVVDTAAALRESGDLLGPFRDGIINHDVPDLKALMHTPALRRTSDQEITVFKSVGTGLADLAVARDIVRIYQSGQFRV